MHTEREWFFLGYRSFSNSFTDLWPLLGIIRIDVFVWTPGRLRYGKYTFHNLHSGSLDVGLGLNKSYLVFYILITECSFKEPWGLWHSWIPSPLYCGRARSCSVVDWTEAKGQRSSQAKVRNFYHCNEAYRPVRRKCLCQSRKSNLVRGRNFSVRILLLTFLFTIYHT